MKPLRYFILFVLIITPCVALATPTQYGESGLISAPTTEITGPGLFQAGAWINYSKIKNGKTFTLLPISISMGLSDGFEAFASYPNILLSTDNDGSGRGYENFGVKFRLTGRDNSKFISTIDAFLRQTISPDNSLNGLKDLGARLIVSYQLPRNTIIYLNSGYLKVDSPSGSNYTDEVLFGGAIEFSGSERLRPFVEVDGNTSRNGGPARVEVTPGMQYYLWPNLSAMIGGGYGATDKGPEYRVVAGLIFASGAGRYVKAVPVIPGSREKYAEASATPEELMPDIGVAPKEPGAEKEGALPVPAPVSEGLESSQFEPPSGSSTPVGKPLGKELMAPGTLTGQGEISPVMLEPPMPVLKTMSAEKAAVAIEKAPLRPEIPSELPSVTFSPPMPAGKAVARAEVAPQPSPKTEPGVTETAPAIAFAAPIGVKSREPGAHEERSSLIEESPAGVRVKKKVEATLGKHKIVLQSDIVFAFNKWEIATSGEKILGEISEEIKNDKGTILGVKLEGHTDNIGSASYNKKLSQKRAESVKAYLVRRGIKPKIISTEGFGYERPVASNETQEGRDKNRRVDITIDYLQIVNDNK